MTTETKPPHLQVVPELETVTETPADPFDLANLRLEQNFAETVGVKKLLRTVPVRKPNKQDYVRVHPGADYRANVPVIELQEDRELYVVSGKDLLAELATEVKYVTLYTAVNRDGVIFLWPVALPGLDGKDLLWWKSAREAAAIAVDTWIRVYANMSLGAYEMLAAEKLTIEPAWPEVSFQELIRIAFKDRLIADLDHPVIQRLRGLV
jgi:hypothetical protein